jgi:hypothetical protein
VPTEDDIQRLAYNLWEQEGRPDGRDQSHWFAAKQILEQTAAHGGTGPTSTVEASVPSSTRGLARVRTRRQPKRITH